MTVLHGFSPVGGKRRRREGAPYLIIPGLAVLALGFLVPLALLIPESLSDETSTGGAYIRMFTDNIYLRIVGNTARLAVMAVIVSVLFGYPMALWISRLGPRAKLLAIIAVVLPFWVSILVRTYSWIVILGQEGLVNQTLQRLGITARPIEFLYTEMGVMIGTTNILAPFFILPMVATMSSIDRRLTGAALSLGASRFQAFWRVFFPLTVPTLISSAFLVFVLTFGFYVTPSILGGGRVVMLATLLDYLVNTATDWSMAGAISIFLLVTTLILMVIAGFLAKLTRPGRTSA